MKAARCIPTSSKGEPRNQFSDYLRETVNGRLILQKHSKNPKDLLSSLEKQFILRRAVDFMLLKIDNFPKEFPRESEYISMWQKIDNIFEGVFSEAEVLGKKLLNSEGKRISSTRGKMQQRVYDVSKQLKAGGEPKQKKRKNDVIPKLVTLEENVGVDDGLNNDVQIEALEAGKETIQKSMDFIRKNKGPEQKVLEAWKETFALRRGYGFDEFPALRMRFGYKLVVFDFEEIYPDKIETFKTSFKNVKKKLLIQYNTEITDKYGKELLKYLDKNNGASETVENLLHLMLSPFLFKHNVSKKRITVAERAKYFISHVKVSLDKIPYVLDF